MAIAFSSQSRPLSSVHSTDIDLRQAKFSSTSRQPDAVEAAEALHTQERQRDEAYLRVADSSIRMRLSPAAVEGLTATVGSPARTLFGYGSRHPNYLDRMLADPRREEALGQFVGHIACAPDAATCVDRIASLSAELRITLNDYLARCANLPAEPITPHTCVSTNKPLYNFVKAIHGGAIFAKPTDGGEYPAAKLHRAIVTAHL